jgi:hypothetical protein
LVAGGRIEISGPVSHSWLLLRRWTGAFLTARRRRRYHGIEFQLSDFRVVMNGGNGQANHRRHGVENDYVQSS